MSPDTRRGVLCGLAAAALFGLSPPLAKRLLPGTDPLVMAGLLYLGAGLGLLAAAALPRAVAGGREAPLRRADLGLLAGVLLAGGVAGPVLMLWGLGRVSGVVGSLLLNLEAPFTILLAVAAFGEHLGRRAALGAAAIVLGGVVLAGRPGELRADWPGAAAIAGACLAWALDNNLTQRLSLRDPIAVVRVKTLGAGAGVLAASLAAGLPLPPAGVLVPMLILGIASYGVSVVLDVYALRRLGAAREAALFATAPFVGALAAVPILGEALAPPDLLGMAAMAAGVALLLRERHAHVHAHAAVEHDHLHVHDEHHQHAHDQGVVGPHAHPHGHAALTHGHPHAPDAHHRHRH